MFCFHCGKSVADGTRFCPHCGTEQTSVTIVPAKDNRLETQDWDRNALNIYLSNVLALECILVDLAEEREKALKKAKAEENSNYVRRFSMPYGYIWLCYHGGKYHIGAFRGAGEGAYTGDFLNTADAPDGDGFVNYVWGQPVYTHNGEFYWGIIDDLSMRTIKKPSFWWDVDSGNFLQDKLRQTGARNAFLDCLEEFKEDAPSRYEYNLVQKVRPAQEVADTICHDYQKAEQLLQEAYAINIIPKQFRNIHAVWFIHDFMTTSAESLSSAFLQCNLDVIKQNLDTIIEQNNRIIVQYAIHIAQNENVMTQNQQMLNHLSSIESNTDRAAQYAQIAANNAASCAWFCGIHYLR